MSLFRFELIQTLPGCERRDLAEYAVWGITRWRAVSEIGFRDQYRRVFLSEYRLVSRLL